VIRAAPRKNAVSMAESDTALRIEAPEANALARDLVRLTGESVTDAVINALRERLQRERARHGPDADLPVRLTALSGRLREAYDTRPVTRTEWDAAVGEHD
jgi:antitoxin VapB